MVSARWVVVIGPHQRLVTLGSASDAVLDHTVSFGHVKLHPCIKQWRRFVFPRSNSPCPATTLPTTTTTTTRYLSSLFFLPLPSPLTSSPPLLLLWQHGAMSAILSAEALNDFIGPSVACIKPVESLPPPTTTELAVAHEDAAPPPDSRSAAQISLTDCLACSGCVTSSEAVLVQMQSHTEVLAALAQPDARAKTFVALLSPQSRAALAVALRTPERAVHAVVARLLTSRDPPGGPAANKAFDMVLDTNPFRRIMHHYAAAEVLEAVGGAGDGAAERRRPILTSSCPGFICYLESTHPALIPHLSTLKSPQAIAATFVKALLVAAGRAREPADVYTVAIMPCFDKKLEAARSELTSAAWRTARPAGTEPPVRDVDCVITTRELLSLAEVRGIDLAALPPSPPPGPPPTLSSDPLIQRFLAVQLPNSAAAAAAVADAGTSGGNLVAVLGALLARHPGATLQVQQGRNADTRDYLVVSPSTGQTIARLSRCYGFRNIQNLVRRLKPAKPRVLPSFGAGGGSRKPAATAASAAASRRIAAKRASASEDRAAAATAYVEVMACPGGCTNGGGQLKFDDEAVWAAVAAEQRSSSQRELLARIDEAYFSSSEGDGRQSRDAEDADGEAGSVTEVVAAFVRLTGVSEDALLRTGYRQVANDLGRRLDDSQVLEMASRSGGGW